MFVDQRSMYSWIYGHTSTAQIPNLFDKFYADIAPASAAPLRDKHARAYSDAVPGLGEGHVLFTPSRTVTVP